MTDWIKEIASISGPRYLAIAETVQRAIDRGVLTAGDRLPAHRALAQRLGTDVGTVSRAYGEMKRRGLVTGEVGRGSFICNRTPDAPTSLWQDVANAHFIDLSHNFPASAPANPEIDEMTSELRRHVDLASLMSFQTNTGQLVHRTQICKWLEQFGISADPSDIVLTAGAQHGLMLALQASTQLGGVVLCESSTYYGALSVCRFLGRTLVGVDMDDEGLLPAALDRACHATGAKVLYCMPTLHNPTTALMSATRREEIARICRRHDVTILEDDVYGFLLDSSIPALCSYAPERTVYISSLSKIVGPGLRFGFIRAPRQLLPGLGAALRATTLMAPALEAELVSRLLRSGAMGRMGQARKRQVQARQASAALVLPSDSVQRHPNAFHVWLKIGQHWHADAFAAAARERGVGVAAGTLFTPDLARNVDAVRICVSAARDDTAVVGAMQILVALIKDGPYASGLTV
jgi:DNA-binding transcriptional MocR family regulator